MTKKGEISMTDEELDRLRWRNREIDELEKWLATLPARVRALQLPNLVVDDQSREAIARATAYAELLVRRNFQHCPNLVLTGQAGTGKTALVWALIFRVIELLYLDSVPPDSLRLNILSYLDLEQTLWEVRRRLDDDDDDGGVRWHRFPAAGSRYCNWDYPARRSYSRQECIDYLIGVDLLALDEIGLKQKTDFSTELLYKIVDGRLAASRPTIVTTNLRLGKAVDAGSLDARVASRLAGGAELIHIVGKDRRQSVEAQKLLQAAPRLEVARQEDPGPDRLGAAAKREAATAEREAADRRLKVERSRLLRSRGLGNEDAEKALVLIELIIEEGYEPDLEAGRGDALLGGLQRQVRLIELGKVDSMPRVNRGGVGT